MNRRAFLSGLAASAALAQPALAWDAFRTRKAMLWNDAPRKPREHEVEFDPDGELSRDLISLIFLNYCQNGQAINDIVVPVRDFVRPWRRWELNGAGATQVQTATQFGPSCSTSGTTVTDNLTPTVANQATTGTSWTVSFISRFDGIGGATYTGQLVAVSDVNSGTGIGINNSTNQWVLFFNSAVSQVTFTVATLVTSLTGWHRITVGTDNTTCFFYLDGVKQDSGTGSPGAFNPEDLVYGWPWPTLDMFTWNHAPNADMVLKHYRNPYGTTMRPRFSELGRRGSSTQGKKPSLLQTGVGP